MALAANITPQNLYSAFSSLTAGLLICWQYSGSTSKSIAELNQLSTFLADPVLDLNELYKFNHDTERKQIEKYLQVESNLFHAEDGWKKSNVFIPLLKEDIEYKSEDDPWIPYNCVEVTHCSIPDVIHAALQDKISATYHMMPFKQYWNNANSDSKRVYCEAYSSPAILHMHEEVNALPRELGDDYEHVVIPLMFWSDATQLANFGDTSLWPIYLFLGNQSKYTHGKPSSSVCHHITYIPKVHCSYIIQVVTTFHVLPTSYQTISKIFIYRDTEHLQPVK